MGCAQLIRRRHVFIRLAISLGTFICQHCARAPAQYFDATDGRSLGSSSSRARISTTSWPIGKGPSPRSRPTPIRTRTKMRSRLWYAAVLVVRVLVGISPLQPYGPDAVVAAPRALTPPQSEGNSLVVNMLLGAHPWTPATFPGDGGRQLAIWPCCSPYPRSAGRGLERAIGVCPFACWADDVSASLCCSCFELELPLCTRCAVPRHCLPST